MKHLVIQIIETLRYFNKDTDFNCFIQVSKDVKDEDIYFRDLEDYMYYVSQNGLYVHTNFEEEFANTSHECRLALIKFLYNYKDSSIQYQLEFFIEQIVIATIVEDSNDISLEIEREQKLREIAKWIPSWCLDKSEWYSEGLHKYGYSGTDDFLKRCALIIEDDILYKSIQ